MEPPNTQSHPSLESAPVVISPPDFFSILPNELIARIVDTIEQDDLPALRSVSKLIHGNSNNRFATEFFKDVPIIMSRKSLNALVDITAHEVFGPYVKSITFNAVRLCDDLRPGRIHVYDTDSNRHEITKLLEKQKVFEESGDALQLFTQALQTIKKRGKGVGLDLDDLEAYAIGYKALWVNDRYSRFCKFMRSSTLNFMLTAATNSRCNIEALELYISQIGASSRVSSEPHLEDPISLEGIDQNTLQNVCSNLLTIGFRFYCPPCGIFEETFGAILKVLKLASRVETISLGLGLTCWKENGWDPMTDPPWPVFKECVRAPSTSSPKSVRLANLATREIDFLKLLKDSCTSLQSLELRKCMLWHGGC